MGRPRKPIRDCLGVDGQACKKKTYHPNALRCLECARKHNAFVKKVRRNEDFKKPDSEALNFMLENGPKEKQRMSLKEYDKLIDVMKNIPE